MPINYILSNDTTILLSIPHGKPDTKIPLKNGVPDTRPRVKRPPQKGPNCSFYSMNMLRDRIGPNPGSDYSEMRRIEKLCSDFYKARTKLDKYFDWFVPKSLKMLSTKGYNLYGPKSTIIEFIPQMRPFIINNEGSNFVSDLEEFCSQSQFENIEDYFKNKKLALWQKVHFGFIESLGLSPEGFYKQHRVREIRQTFHDDDMDDMDDSELFASYSLPWDQTINNLVIPQTLAFMAAFNALGFKNSTWTPYQSVVKLQESLRAEGGLIVGGYYGVSFYKNPPTATRAIAGLPVYSWKASDRHAPEKLAHLNLHFIVVIGASTEGSKGGQVYFLNPQDGSDPQDPLQQKIYVISYENFVSNISDIRGWPSAGAEKSVFGYAQYYVSSIPSEEPELVAVIAKQQEASSSQLSVTEPTAEAEAKLEPVASVALPAVSVLSIFSSEQGVGPTKLAEEQAKDLHPVSEVRMGA